jgi:hypothetical protein
MRLVLPCGLLLALSTLLQAQEFSAPPSVRKLGDQVQIEFAVSAATDVEVSILNAKGEVVRHLAAGVLGGKLAPPAPLKAGLAQSLFWDGKDDFGKPAAGAPIQVRVRLGSGFKFGRFLGEDPYSFGAVDGVCTDEAGNLYISGYAGVANQGARTVRMYDVQGQYLRELMPFPANLKTDAMKEAATWNEDQKSWFPRNASCLVPDFYVANFTRLTLLSASPSAGLAFASPEEVYKLNADGSVFGASFGTKQKTQPVFDAKDPNKNHYEHPWHYQVGPLCYSGSPDGKYLYLTGAVPNPEKRKKPDPRFPLGGIYRMALDGKDEMKLFASLPAEYSGPWSLDGGKNYSATGPIHFVGFDARNNVYVPDRQANRVVVFSENGKQIGEFPCKNPEQIVVHPTTGSVYVLRKVCNGWNSHAMAIEKFSGYGPDAKSLAIYDKIPNKANPKIALAATANRSLVWVAGMGDGVLALEDKGAALTPVETRFKPRPEAQVDWNRLSVDYARDELYVSDGGNKIWRYEGKTGDGGIFKDKTGKPLAAVDLSVGYDGLLYIRTGESFSGPLERYTRDLEPAPYPGGSHVISPSIYSRYGIGNCEKGLGVGPKGEVYISFMYDWTLYAVGGFGPDGKALQGEYLSGKFPAAPDKLKGYPPELRSSVIGPVTAAGGGIRVDLQGNIYLGLDAKRDGAPPAANLATDEVAKRWTSSVLKFGPKGGAILGLKDSESKQPDAPKIVLDGKRSAENALNLYSGLGPVSGAGPGGNSSCCVCRVPRFDVDRYGRLAIPSAFSAKVLYYDNSGNLIASIGSYGNFDSQYVNPATEEGKAKKAAVSTPEIPLAWPSGAGFSENSIYLCDTYNRRAVRVDKTFKAEAACAIP